jgi:hypothetical protein
MGWDSWIVGRTRNFSGLQFPRAGWSQSQESYCQLPAVITTPPGVHTPHPTFENRKAVALSRPTTGIISDKMPAKQSNFTGE